MSFRKRVADLDLVAILLLCAALELALNRLAVPVLRPPGNRPPPDWHRNLDTIGLFVFHLTSILALGVGAWKTWDLVVRRVLTGPLLVSVAAVGAGFYALATWSMFLSSPQVFSFHLESAFTTLLLLLGATLVLRGKDRLVQLGFVALAAPFFVHYYGTFVLKIFMSGEGARGSSLPDRMRDLGQWSIALTAVAAAVCLAPRPLRQTVLRPGPAAIAAVVATISAVIMRRHYEVGVEIASRGLGIELGPDAPIGIIAAYVVAVAAVSWSLAATFTAESPARRHIGMGLALVGVSGYAFFWPLQLLTAVAGVLAIVDGGTRVWGEESEQASALKGPPIAQTTWRAYVDALAGALGASSVSVSPQGGPQGSVEETRLVGRRGALPYSLHIVRPLAGVQAVEIVFGDGAAALGEPPWTLFARGGLLGNAHPAPPASRAPILRTGDEAFDGRFRLQDRLGLTRRLLDDGLRARAAALLDGWVAIWPGRRLQYRVCPGRGAPLDHPVPISELAFRGGDPGAATDRLVCVFELLAVLAERTVPIAGEA